MNVKDLMVQERNSKKLPLLVGVGASAGGLKAMEAFLTPLTRKMDFAVVFIQHFSAHYKNLLPELVQSLRSDLEIIEISDHLPLRPGCIYLCPPGKKLLVEHGVFHLSSQPKDRLRLSIDEFFVSLAAEAGERAVAVILAGEGTDGAQGIRTIRNAGGAVFVQDPATTEFAEMPLASIRTGRADAVLSPEEIIKEILKLQESKDSAKRPEKIIQPLNEELITVNAQLQAKIEEQDATNNDLSNFLAGTNKDVSELKKAEAQVRHLASFPQLNPHPVLEFDASGKIAYLNPATARFLESRGMGREEANLFLPADMDNILGDWDRKTETTLYREITIKDRIFSASVHLAPQFNVVRIYTGDITEQKRAGSVLQSRLRLVAAAYTGAMSMDEVLRLTLDEIEAQTGSQIGFYHFLEPDQETLSLQNWSSNTVQTMCTAEGKGSHYNISQAGVWVDCVREKRAVIHNDYAALPHRRGMPPGHAPINREMVIPILRNDRIVAIIGVGNKPSEYNTTDIEIALLLGDFSWEIIERKRAEEALRESKERLNRSQAIAHLGSWELDLVNNRLFWSDEVYRIFGLQPQEFAATYEAFLEAVHPDDRAAVDAAYSDSLREGRDTYEIEHRVAWKATGELRYVHEKCQHFRNKTGRIIRSVGMVHDITELKQAEEERETAVAFLRMVNESTGKDNLIREATAFFKAHTRCSAVAIRLRLGNDYPYYDAAGFSEEFIQAEKRLCRRDEAGKAILDASGNPVLECLCGIVISGQVDPVYPFFTPRGSFWTNSTTELLATAAGADLRTGARNRCNKEGYESVALIPLVSGDERLGLLQLDDRQKGRFSRKTVALWERLAGYLAVALVKFRAEEALRANEVQLKAIIANLNEGLVVADLAGQVFHWNPTAGVMLGFADLEELRRRAPEFNDIFELSTAEAGMLPVEQRPLARVLKGETLRDWEVFMRRRDTDWQRVFSYSGTLAKDKEGKPLVAVLTFSDITERKRTEENIVNLNRDISAKNAELEAANRDLAAFIYSVSHDLRGPLRSMSVFAKILAESYAHQFDEKGKEYFLRINAASGKMNRLIDDLLYLSRVSRQEIKRSSFDLSAMSSHIVAELREAAPGHDGQVKIKKGITVFADPQLLELSLANLLGNAWKFTSKTKNPHIVVGKMERNGTTVYFVKDNGVGFDPEYAGKMFQPFQRLHSDDEFEGTGIGLAIVEQAIRRHGGKLWAEGAVGKGATIYFTLEEQR